MPVVTQRLKKEHPRFSEDELRYEVQRPHTMRPKVMTLAEAEKTLNDAKQRKVEAMEAWDRRIQTAQDVVNSIKAAE